MTNSDVENLLHNAGFWRNYVEWKKKEKKIAQTIFYFTNTNQWNVQWPHTRASTSTKVDQKQTYIPLLKIHTTTFSISMNVSTIWHNDSFHCDISLRDTIESWGRGDSSYSSCSENKKRRKKTRLKKRKQLEG